MGFKSGGIDTSDATAYPQHVMSGYTFYARGEKLTGIKENISKYPVSSLSVARYDFAATTGGNYALFGGGYASSGKSAVVDTYNGSLTKGTASNLNQARDHLAATFNAANGYILFACGYNINASPSNEIDIYISSTLSKGRFSAYEARYYLAATSVGSYGLIAGGRTSGGGLSAVVDVVPGSGAMSTASSLSAARYGLAATTVGNYALFGGGYNSNVVDSYNSALTRGSVTTLSTNRYNPAATTIGNYALFGSVNTVDTYNTSLTKGVASNFSINRAVNPAATHTTNYALFGGGSGSNATVDTYNKSLTKGVAPDLNQARNHLAATSIGGYALFGGGNNNGGSTYSTVDAYYEV